MKNFGDKVCTRILDKFIFGDFTFGEKCELARYYYDDKTIHSFTTEERTPEVCASLMHYSKCKLSDVPMSSRTREFYIDTFTDDDVYKYIRNNVSLFDRQFFKDLIVTNKYALIFDKNCFEIMPVEYIDDEMVSLAILHANNWASERWLKSVIRRNKDAISEEVWKLAARLYVREGAISNEIFTSVPKDVKDEEYYYELCLCNFNEGMMLDTNKGKIMDLVPDEYITESFIIRLVNENIKNAARFNEKAFNMEVPVSDGTKVVVWKYLVKSDGYLMQYIPLNQERIDFFLSLYSKQSGEYMYGFKPAYKKYKKEMEDPEGLEQQRRDEDYKNYRLRSDLFFHSMAFAMDGEDPSKAIDLVSDLNKADVVSSLPIKYYGLVPEEYATDYDREEYLEMVYKSLGIKVLGEQDRLFYKVELPEGWIVTGEHYWYKVLNQDGEEMFSYFYDPKFYDSDAYVNEITNPKDVKKKTLQ